jgi:O-antigen/teichoic acid export membrane protein
VSQAHHERAGGGAGPLLQVSRASAALAGLVFAPLVAVNPPFVRWWVGAGHDLGAGYAAATAAGLFLYSLLNAWALPLVGVGALRPVAWPFGLSTAVAVAGSWLAVHHRLYTVGMLAIAAAPLAVLVYPVPNLLAAHLGVPRRQLLVAVARPLLLAAAPMAGLAVLCVTLPDRLAVRSGLATGYVLVLGVVLLFLELTAAERTKLAGRLPLHFLRRRR